MGPVYDSSSLTFNIIIHNNERDNFFTIWWLCMLLTVSMIDEVNFGTNS